MKTNSTNLINKSSSFTVFAALLVTTLFTVSCRKDTTTATTPAYVMAINVDQGSTAQDFYLDGAKLTSGLAYGQNTAYNSITSNTTHTIQFKGSSTGTVDSSLQVLSLPSAYYSAYYSNSSTIEYYRDGTTAPPTGYATVRIINLSTALTSGLDFANVAGGVSTVLVSGDQYPAASSYNNILAGSTTFTVASAGSSTVLLSIPVTLQAGYIYSIAIVGSSTSTLAYNMVTEVN